MDMLTTKLIRSKDNLQHVEFWPAGGISSNWVSGAEGAATLGNGALSDAILFIRY